MSETWTEVNIDFYMPEGFSSRYWVKTDDRGKAMFRVLALYDKELKCINDIRCRLCGGPNPLMRGEVLTL